MGFSLKDSRDIAITKCTLSAVDSFVELLREYAGITSNKELTDTITSMAEELDDMDELHELEAFIGE